MAGSGVNIGANGDNVSLDNAFAVAKFLSKKISGNNSTLPSAAEGIAEAQQNNGSSIGSQDTTPSSSADPSEAYDTTTPGAIANDTKFAMLGTASDLKSVGSALFPMLFLYAIADTKNMADDKLISKAEKDCIVKNLKDWSDKQKGHTEAGATNGTDMYSSLCGSNGAPTNKAKQYSKMFKTAIEKNSNYSWMLCNACTNLMAKYKGRIPVTGGAYYQDAAKKTSSYWPILKPEDDNIIDNCMRLLSLLLKNGIIDYSFDLGIRPLDIQAGTFFTQEQYSASIMERMRVCGKPVKGQFTINTRQTTPQFYHTFSGVDITAVGSVGNVVTRLEGLTQLSWSVHAGKTTQKPLGKTNGGSRNAGTRTVAGTMVFTMFDHHPLLDLLPADLTKYTAKSATSGKQRLYRPRYMADQIPPFDLTVILMNEYGYASVVTLYGVQVPDEGAVLSVDNLVTEIVCQYTAVAMDPIVEVTPDENGNIDPYGMISGGWSDLWEQREVVIQGVAYSDLEDAYESFYESNGLE